MYLKEIYLENTGPISKCHVGLPFNRHYINLIVKCFSVSLGSVGAGFPRPIARHQRSYPGRGDLAPTRFPECPD